MKLSFLNTGFSPSQVENTLTIMFCLQRLFFCLENKDSWKSWSHCGIYSWQTTVHQWGTFSRHDSRWYNKRCSHSCRVYAGIWRVRNLLYFYVNEQQCFIRFKTQGIVQSCCEFFWTASKSFVVDLLICNNPWVHYFPEKIACKS